MSVVQSEKNSKVDKHWNWSLRRKYGQARDMYQRVPAKIAKIMKISWKRDREQTSIVDFFFNTKWSSIWDSYSRKLRKYSKNPFSPILQIRENGPVPSLLSSANRKHWNKMVLASRCATVREGLFWGSFINSLNLKNYSVVEEPSY